MIRSFITNLPIGQAQAEKRPTKPSNVKSDRAVSFDLCKHGTEASDGTVKEIRTSRITDFIAFSVSNLDACDDGKSAVGSSSSGDDLANAVFLLNIANEDDDSSISDLSSFTTGTISDNPDVMDPITPSFSKELYTTYAWDSDSYSLVLLEQQWFRLAKNSSFSAALYLQGLTEVLHTCRGIFANYKDETLHLVIDQEKKIYRLDRTNYRKGITACCSGALHTMSAHDE